MLPPIVLGWILVAFGLARLITMGEFPVSSHPDILTTSIIAIAVGLIAIIHYLLSCRHRGP